MGENRDRYGDLWEARCLLFVFLFIPLSLRLSKFSRVPTSERKSGVRVVEVILHFLTKKCLSST